MDGRKNYLASVIFAIVVSITIIVVGIWVGTWFVANWGTQFLQTRSGKSCKRRDLVHKAPRVSVALWRPGEGDVPHRM